MLKGTKLRIASNVALAEATMANTAAIDNQARVQRESNNLYKRDLETRDRVNISKVEYEELIKRSKLSDKLAGVVSGICDASKLTLEELSSIKPDKVDAIYNNNCIDFSFDVVVRLRTDLPLYRQRELMGYK